MLRQNDIDPESGSGNSTIAVTPEDIRRVVDISPLAAFVLDRDEKIAYANASFGRLIGREAAALAGTDLRDVVTDASPTLPVRGEWELEHSNGSPIAADVFCRQLPEGGYLVFPVDISGRKKAEADVLEAEKKRWQSLRIEALGRLAGGIAHDFNNFLAVLLLQVDIMGLHLEKDSPIRERVNEIKEVSNSVAGTVRQLFAFGRKQPMTLAPTAVNSVIADFASDLGSSFKDISVELDLADDLGLCFVDRVQIRQILQNLLVNAREGMPEGGSFRVRTSNVSLTSSPSPDVQPAGPYVEIAISDTGAGIDPSSEDHIFEPFFSNQDSDKGAGLTLAMVYGIVKQSKGFIWAEQNSGRGTTFKLQFPRIDLAAGETAAAVPAVGQPQENRTVLLVDDEAAVRRVTAEFLKISSYEVLQAGSGMEALEIAQSFPEPIHLLLTDLSMPFMDGRQLAEKLCRIHPETLVLYMSGNIDHLGDEQLSNDSTINFISKPFSSIKLADKVLEVLDHSRN